MVLPYMIVALSFQHCEITRKSVLEAGVEILIKFNITVIISCTVTFSAISKHLTHLSGSMCIKTQIDLSKKLQ